MFKDKAIREAYEWNLRRCKNAKRVLKKVEKDLLYKAKRKEFHDKYGIVKCVINVRLSRDGFEQLKKMCQEEGIVFLSKWTSPFPEEYCFALKVR